MRIVVLTGGTSSERDVALASGLEIAAALRERDHAVDVVDLATGFVPREHEAALLPGGVGRAPPPLARLKELERGIPGRDPRRPFVRRRLSRPARRPG